jgi:ATP-dependent exoDNAse (exonuclease V) beta subunit
MLQREGVVKVQLEEACGRVETALDNALRDPRGQWLLSREHSHAHSELPLTAVLGGRVRRMVVDRTFVDENGVRWVVDYKTGAHAGGDVESFLDQEAERYREQLTAYAATLRRLDDREVRAGLYFPLIAGGWRELECGSE